MSSERRERRVRETEAKVWRSGPCSGRSLADLISGITQASRHSARDVGSGERCARGVTAHSGCAPRRRLDLDAYLLCTSYMSVVMSVAGPRLRTWSTWSVQLEVRPNTGRLTRGHRLTGSQQTGGKCGSFPEAHTHENVGPKEACEWRRLQLPRPSISHGPSHVGHAAADPLGVGSR